MVVVMALVPRSFHYQSVVCRMLLSFSCLQNPLAGFSCRRPGAVWPGVCLEIHIFDHHKKGIPEHLGGHVFGNPFSVQLKKGIPMQLVADHQIGVCGGPPSQGITPPPQKRPSSCFYEPTSRALWSCSQSVNISSMIRLCSAHRSGRHGALRKPESVQAPFRTCASFRAPHTGHGHPRDCGHRGARNVNSEPVHLHLQVGESQV